MTVNLALILTLLVSAILTLSFVWPGTAEQAMSKPGRIPADLERDKRSKPQGIIPLLNLRPGDRVVDI